MTPTEQITSTRTLTTVAVVGLSIQLVGNLYEQVVTNVQSIVDPVPGRSVDELAAGSPLFFYMPWVPIGIAATVMIWRKSRDVAAPSSRPIARALLLLGVAAVAKAVLIAMINPTFRDPTVAVDTVRANAIWWALGNGIAILAVAAAIGSLLQWRMRLVDRAVRRSD